MKPSSFFVALMALILVSFADIPGPEPSTVPYVVLNVTYDGQPVPDGTVVNAYCIVNGKLSGVPTTSFACEGGICRNSGWYKLSPCAREENATAIFELSHPSFGAINTTPLPIKRGMTYYYDIRLGSNGTSEEQKTSEEEAGGKGGICLLGFFLPLLALGIEIARD